MDPEDQRKKAKSKPTLSLHLHFQLGHERFSADLPYAFTLRVSASIFKHSSATPRQTSLLRESPVVLS